MGKMILSLFLILNLNQGAVAQTQKCKLDPALRAVADSGEDALRDQIAQSQKQCEEKLYNASSVRDSQHACACKNYVGKLSERDIFETRFAKQIQEVKDQYKEQTGGNPANEQKLVNDLYSNYQKAKDNLPCGNNAKIFPNINRGMISGQNGGFYCAANQSSADSMNLPLCSDTKKASAARDALQKETMDTYQTTFGDGKGLTKQFVCDGNPPTDQKDWNLVSQDIPPCSLNFQKKFLDNTTGYQSGITDSSVQKEIQSSDCYKKIASEGMEVDHIDIETSSSLLANTGVAVDKTFRQLSNDRADKIKNDVFKKVPGLENVTYNTNTAGKNGDGTSGPCPYTYSDNAPFWSRRSDVPDEKLEEDKYVRAKIYYKNKKTPLVGKGNRTNLNCSTVTFGCTKDHTFPATAFK